MKRDWDGASTSMRGGATLSLQKSPSELPSFLESPARFHRLGMSAKRSETRYSDTKIRPTADGALRNFRKVESSN